MCTENCPALVALNVRVSGEYKMALLAETVEWGLHGTV